MILFDSAGVFFAIREGFCFVRAKGLGYVVKRTCLWVSCVVVGDEELVVGVGVDFRDVGGSR